MKKDYAIQVASSNLRYGIGVTNEVGMDFKDMGVKRVLLITDENLKNLTPVQRSIESLNSESIDFELYTDVRVEPNDLSFIEAINFAKKGKFDAFLAVGGGSTIDTAKAANLYSTYPSEFLTYVNAPIGEGKPIPGPLKPLIAIPTTAGTGSETTGVAIFDLSDRHVKTGIANRFLKPSLAIVDPENTKDVPPVIIASSGLDVLCHALESYTAIDFNQRPLPERPIYRPAYQGNNPISDIWSIKAIDLVSKNIVRAYRNPNDLEARSNMILASSMAGIGFGNAGVHLCHGMSYPVSGMVKNFIPHGLTSDHPIIPHGLSVILNAPAVFKFTGEACPERHLKVAKIMGAKINNIKDPKNEAGLILSNEIIKLMKDLEVPNGLSAIGFNKNDIPNLIKGTLPQHRVTKLSPRSANAEDLNKLFNDSMTLW
ncbi:MAG: alcohol dehydrogenase [Flavobacteriaceae bacterium]|nr:alcohol dehydrogenase [Flavobacteriaceae bacterium]|tara:strand:- start:73281 stop:74564 length:1284 start_codon:yes stop_codon:yes gene_type:complete